MVRRGISRRIGPSSKGSYETVNSRVEPAGGERMIDAARGLLYGLKYSEEGD